MIIPLVNIQAGFKAHNQEQTRAVLKVLNSGSYILGKEVNLFEKSFSKYLKVKNVIGVSSGTAALSLALRASGIVSGDKVIIPANSYPTVFALSDIGAIPVLVDIDAESYTMDSEKIESVIDKKTKAIIPVHLYGQTANMSQILKLARKYKLLVVEDCAQATGAQYKNKYHVGTIGDIGCFSFYPTKTLGACGDGGAVVTNNDLLARKLKRFRIYGEGNKRYYSTFPGTNSRLDEIQAAILSVRLSYLDEDNKKRYQLAQKYKVLLKDVPQVHLPKEVSWSTHVYHLFTIRCEKRDRLKSFLEAKGIAAGFHYPIPIHLQPAFTYLSYQRGDFPVAERIANEILSLPIYPQMTLRELTYVCDAVKEYYNRV